MKIINFMAGFFQDKGVSSSKRLVGIVCSAFLCHKLYVGTPANETVIYAVTALAFGSLGLSSVEKVFGKKSLTDVISPEPKTEEPKPQQ